MQTDLSVPEREDASVPEASSAGDQPRWLSLLDTIVIAILNVALFGQVLLIFASTVVRSFTHSSALMGVAETVHPFLILVSFLGGAVSYARGYFIVITIFVDRMPARMRGFSAAFVQWIVIAITLPLAVYSIQLYSVNSEARTILLGIGFEWMTFPITAGAALFVAHAAVELRRQRLANVVASGLTVAAMLVLFWLVHDTIGARPVVLYSVMLALFVGFLVLAVPIGFVLAATGIVCVLSVGSGDMIAVVMNAQRGSSGFILLALPFFVLAGFIMDKADIGGRIVDFVGSLIGHVRGGLLQVMVVGCYLGSCVSGSKAADMAMIGIPMSKRLEEYGYPPHERAAVLASSAAMAEAVPPSIALILVGSTTGISTGALFLAGILPALALAICLMILIRFRAAKFGWEPTARAPVREVARTGGRAILPLLMPVILIGGIIGGFGTPTEVSTFAVLYGLLVGMIYRRFTTATFWQTLTEASLLNGMIFFTISAATIFSWALTLEGVTTALADLAGGLGRAGFIIAVIGITIFVAAVLESFVTIIILAPLLLPVAMQLDVDPLQYGILMTEAFGIGSILPPIGIALYVACKISGARVEPTSRVVLLYISILLFGLLIVASVPAITTTIPWLFGFAG